MFREPFKKVSFLLCRSSNVAHIKQGLERELFLAFRTYQTSCQTRIAIFYCTALTPIQGDQWVQ